jgi:ribulose-phosphate 3-epimerase
VAIKIFPSLISADILNLEHEIKKLEPHCDGFHIDVMDWHFVPNLTWGPMFINAIAQKTTKPLFVHLMIEKSLEFLDLLALRNNDIVSFHIEESHDIKKMIKCIKEKRWRPNIAIKPKTPVEKFFPFSDMVDSILLMSVEPGFSGQHFLKSSTDRLIALTTYRTEHNLSFEIDMDGGINKENISMLVNHGVNSVAIAAGIFEHHDPVYALKELYKAAAQ